MKEGQGRSYSPSLVGSPRSLQLDGDERRHKDTHENHPRSQTAGLCKRLDKGNRNREKVNNNIGH